MGNRIRLDGNNPKESFSMSNRGTDAFLNVLLISGSPLAKTINQKQLLVWLAEKDQVISRGNSGFDITDMPWNVDTFDDDKAFLISVINAALEHKKWELLDYSPNSEIVDSYLEQFKALVTAVTPQIINKAALHDWLSDKDSDDPVNCGFPKCKRHGVMLSFFGCQVCNG